MRKLIAALAVAAVVASVSSCGGKRTKAARLLENYALVTIPAPDLSGISDNGKEVLNLYRFASDQADAIYWQQNFGPKSTFDALEDSAEKEFAYVNYGPWNRIDGEPFIYGYGPKPLGACFYPADMTDEEFKALKDPAKESPYTIIRRKEDGSLEVVWYHDAYKEQVRKISDLLKAAADITIKESVRQYLLAKAEDVLTDNYLASEFAWQEMTDSKMDLVIGPGETIDDELYGIKASYGAYVLLKNEERTNLLRDVCVDVPGLDPEFGSKVYSCDVIYYGGYPNAGYKNIGCNLSGNRAIIFDNIIKEKFNRTVFPAGMLLFEGEDQAHLDANAFWWEIVFREIAKSMVEKNAALGNEALTFEKAEAHVLGALLSAQMVEGNHIGALITKQDVVATFIANTIRSTRFGFADATGRANLIVYNFLTEQGAISRKVSGKYVIDYAKTIAALEALNEAIKGIQAGGDYDAAVEFAGTYAFVPQAIQQDVVALELEKIPVDIRFEYEK